MGSRRNAALAAWALAGVAGMVALLVTFPHVFPFFPRQWTLNREEATAVALERFRDLGEPVAGGLVVAHLGQTQTIEQRLLQALGRVDAERLRGSLLAGQAVDWEVRVYPDGALPQEWRYRARITLDGRVLDLQERVPADEPGDGLEVEEGRRRAEEFLRSQGFRREDFGEPTVRRRELLARTDLAVRFPAAEAVLGEEVPYGLEVTFAGDRLTGYQLYHDIPDASELQAAFQPINLLSFARVMVPFLLFPVVAVSFLRRYHAGEVGVRRAVHIFILTFGSGSLLMALAGLAASEGVGFGILSRAQTGWAWSLQIVVFWISALAVVASLSWSVGEALSRERWPQKLAAFDALFQGRVRNATVARSALRGFSGGLALAGGMLLVLDALPRELTRPMGSFVLGPWWESARWPGLALVCFTLVYCLFSELFARLFVLSTAARRLGRWGAAALVVLISAVAFWPAIGGTTVVSSCLFALLQAAFLVALFLRYDLLTTVMAAVAANVAVGAVPLLLAEDPFLQFQGALPLLLVALPALVSLRDLAGGREFAYRWEDVPPHVRRITERERQRVELETARRIQSSILPDLPAQLNGVEISHAYLPASEVGGDFYDVLALEDGRLAVAVGDVAGHGVSSGLVMSMAKSALAVQVAVDPDVARVFRTLNRTVYQTARKRLLATLCYALLDPQRRTLLYASAGHLFPYRLGTDGGVEALESVAYPLGVRGELEVLPKEARLAPGDTLFLFSDGIVEARREGTEEPFGFERLEHALERFAGEPVARLRDAVLAEVERFTGPGPREDDFTVLVLRLP
jgi:hypothetical protein